MAKDSIRCDVTGNTYPSISVRECPSPAVIKRYGTGGVARVCVHVCRRCKFAITFPYYGGVGCQLVRLTQGVNKQTEQKDPTGEI